MGQPADRADGRLVLEHRLKELIIGACRVASVRPEDIDAGAQLIGGPGPLQLDSLDALEIAMAIRREFGIEIEDLNDATAAFASIRELASFIDQRAVAGGRLDA